MHKTPHRRLAVLSGHLKAQVAESQSVPASPIPCSGRGAGLLAGQVAVITGAGQGLGAAAARLFAQEGAKVVITDLEGVKAEQVAEDIRAAGGEASALSGDVTSVDFPGDCVRAAVKAFGTIDILVNNAGYTWDGMVHKLSSAQWEAMLAVHCTAPFRLIQAAAPVMRDAAKRELEAGAQARPRCIINVSSTSGTHGNPGQANYSTAKAGVLGLTKTVAKEWGPFNIRCNAVTYGYIATRLTGEKGEASIKIQGKDVALGIPGGDAVALAAAEMMIPMKRIGTPQEAAGAMLLLASPYASFVTGQSLEVSGGAYV